MIIHVGVAHSLPLFLHYLQAQVLQPFAVSSIETCSTQALWEGASKGNKGVEFFTEFAAAGDAYRQGIAVSRLACVVKLGIARLKDENTAKLIDSNILEKAIKEADALMPSLDILDGGKASQNSKAASLSSLAPTVEASKKQSSEKDVDAASTVTWWIIHCVLVEFGFRYRFVFSGFVTVLVA